MVTQRMSCTEYIPLAECRHGHLYEILARNFTHGIFNILDNSFIGIRMKFGDRFLFPEYHWDYDSTYGTAKPIKELEVYPGEVNDKNMFKWLDEHKFPEPTAEWRPT